MSDPQLSFATSPRYDTQFLLRGAVKVKDFDIRYQDVGGHPFSAFRDLVTNISYDIGDLAFSHYLIAKDMGKPLTAIPAFTSRWFCHMGAIVRKEIRTPQDLAGKRVGVMGFGYNPATWLRGIFVHQYDVSVERITWVEDAADDMFRGLDYPRSRRFTIEKMSGLTEQMINAYVKAPPPCLETGALDGLFAPAWGLPTSDKTHCLFEDPLAEARKYYSATDVFPINTVIVLKESVAKQYPKLPVRLLEAHSEARRMYHEALAAGRDTEPGGRPNQHMGYSFDFLKELGVFPDRYGLAPNRKAVNMMIHYCYEQGLIKRLYTPEELFVIS